jgi:hypothetical protein
MIARALLIGLLAMPLTQAFAQAPPGGAQPLPGGALPLSVAAPLVFKVEWVRPASQEDTKVRYMPVQANIADPNVVMTFYGKAAKQILTTSIPGLSGAPYGVWGGTAEGPYAVTFKPKTGSLDMTGLAYVRWVTKTAGFHAVRPVIKLANGDLLVGDMTFESVAKATAHEFSLLNIRWLKLDPERIVTLAPPRSPANPNPGTWAPAPDLTKVDEIGFADLMPGSGHGQGGYIQLGGIEVYGKVVQRP